MRDNCCNHHVENNDDDISITLLSQMSSRSSLTFDFSAHHSTSRLCLHQILMTCLGRAAAGAWIHGFLKVANNHQILNTQHGYLILKLQLPKVLILSDKLNSFFFTKRYLQYYTIPFCEEILFNLSELHFSEVTSYIISSIYNTFFSIELQLLRHFQL